MKSFHIKTFGCQMNEADSERMEALLIESGLTPDPNNETADLLIFNGCTVREKAVHKMVSALGKFSPEEFEKKKQLIGVTGCVGQLEKAEMFKRAPFVDFVLGTDAIDFLPEAVFRASQGERHLVSADFDERDNYSTRTKVVGEKSQAFVNIMKGCDKYCSYCIVPFTRGREKSRLIDEVLEDLARLAIRGVKEITLLGQNVNSFGKGNLNIQNREPKVLHNVIGRVGPDEGEENFPQLLRAIDTDSRLSSIERIRFTSSHPLDFSDELLACYALDGSGIKKLVHHLHLPVQSGSNRVLQRMGRHHKIEGYIEQMEKVRVLNPAISLTTDLIVGFPGETREDFEQTLKLMQRLQYDNVFAFAYSERPGTKAAKFADDIPESEKNARLNELLDFQKAISEQKNRNRVGLTADVLIEGLARTQKLAGDQAGAKVWSGRLNGSAIVNIPTSSPRNFTGLTVSVKISGSSAHSLTGSLEE